MLQRYRIVFSLINRPVFWWQCYQCILDWCFQYTFFLSIRMCNKRRESVGDIYWVVCERSTSRLFYFSPPALISRIFEKKSRRASEKYLIFEFSKKVTQIEVGRGTSKFFPNCVFIFCTLEKNINFSSKIFRVAEPENFFSGKYSASGKSYFGGGNTKNFETSKLENHKVDAEVTTEK